MTNNNTDAVVIERLFDAPIETMWAMWTEPQHFAAWYGPHGATIPVAKLDVRVSGTRLICMEMRMPDRTMQMWFTGEYREIIEHRKLVYTEAMCDEHGVVQPAPPGHPAATEITVEFERMETRTRIVMTHAGIPADSPGAMGWNMALDKLTALVAAS